MDQIQRLRVKFFSVTFPDAIMEVAAFRDAMFDIEDECGRDECERVLAGLVEDGVIPAACGRMMKNEIFRRRVG